MTLDHRTDSTELVLELVSDRCRRTVLQYLIEGNGQAVHLEELTEHVAGTVGRPASRTDSLAPGPEPSPEDRLEIVLCHSHLPKLDDAGVIDYDARSATVRYRSTPRLEKLVAFVESELD